MNRADVIRLAKEAGIQVTDGNSFVDDMYISVLYRFANLVEAQQSDKYKALAGELAAALDALIAAETNEAWRYPTVWGPIVRKARAALAKYEQEKGV
jgi:hypothetical protein